MDLTHTVLRCSKSGHPISEDAASYCAYYINKSVTVDNSGPAQEKTQDSSKEFTSSDRATLRSSKDQGIFSNKKVLLTGQYSSISRDEIISLLNCMNISQCIEPEDADIVIKANGKKTYKLRAAHKLLSAGKSIRILSEQEFIEQVHAIVRKNR